MSKKVIIIIIGSAVVLGFGIHQIFFKEDGADLSLAEVKRTKITKEVSETGVVRKGTEKIDLSFKNSGRVDKIFVEVGEQIEPHQKLAELDTEELLFQLREAEAALTSARADYEKIITGPTSEEIRVTEADVQKAEVALGNAKQNLEDVKENAQEDLDNALQDALNVLDDAYLELYDCYNLVSYLQRTYFYSGTDQTAAEIKYKLRGHYKSLEDLIDIAKETFLESDIDLALSEAKDSLEEASDNMETLRDLSDSSSYVDSVTASDKSSITTQKASVNSVYADVSDAAQDISGTKITNRININTAQAEVSSAESALQKTEEELAFLTADPRSEDVELYRSKVTQAESKVSQLRTKLEDAVLKSPFAGQVSRIEKEEGELVQPQDIVITILPASPFQIKVDIYEEDIVEVNVGDSVKINLVAFPEEPLLGEVSAIDPAEKMIEGVVYYETTITFKETREGIKSGMTADVDIETAKKENILAVPEDAVEENKVEVFSDNKREIREIETGMEGEDLIEVVSGLQEGERVIVK